MSYEARRLLTAPLLDVMGVPLSGGRIRVFDDGGVLHADIYADRDCTVPEANPAALDYDGYRELWVKDWPVSIEIEDCYGRLCSIHKNLSGPEC